MVELGWDHDAEVRIHERLSVPTPRVLHYTLVFASSP